MGRKTRKEMPGEEKKMTKYADRAPHWIRRLAEEVEELADAVPQDKRWEPPRRLFIEFSTQEKPAYVPRPKERGGKEDVRKREKRADTRRDTPRKGGRVRRGKRDYK